MTVSKAQLLSTGAALRRAEAEGIKREDIARVTIDDEHVDADAARSELTAAEAAIEKAQADARAAAAEPPSIFARAMRSVTSTVTGAAGAVGSWTSDNVVKPSTSWLGENVVKPSSAWLEETAPSLTNKVKTAATAALNVEELTTGRPEDVDRKATVTIVTHGGSVVSIPVIVRDELTTQILRATSAAASSAGFVPIYGNFVQGGTGLVAMLASGATFLAGDKQLAKGLFGMGKKHLRMGIIGFLPGATVATSPVAINDLRRVTGAELPIDQMVRDDDARRDA